MQTEQVVTKKYLWLPVRIHDVTETKDTVIIYVYEKTCQKYVKWQELYMNVAWDNTEDAFAWIPMDTFRGQKIKIEVLPDVTRWQEETYIRALERWCSQLHFSDKLPENATKNRPEIHYAPVFGWMNDPNGLLYHDGIYHVYHQHNPYGTQWENIHWAHTETKDFVHWTKTEDVLLPAEKGPAFSGTGIVDEQNLLSYGKDAFIFYYTLAGGRSKWSTGFHFTQNIAYSTDGGKHMELRDECVIPHIADENRDPKVFYHEESAAYICIIYIQEDLFRLYRSTDLVNWTRTQDIRVPGMWECPDFFRISAENESIVKWVFWSADGYYCLGDFDGYGFTPDKDREGNIIRQEAYNLLKDEKGKPLQRIIRAYAAQTFQHVKDRILQLSWITTAKEDKNYAGILSLPAEITLCKTFRGYKVMLQPSGEVLGMRRQMLEPILTENALPAYVGNGKGVEIELQIALQDENQQDKKGVLICRIFENKIVIDLTEREIRVDKHIISIQNKNSIRLQIYVDVDVLELFADGGTQYCVVDNKSDSLNGMIVIEQNEVDGSIHCYELNTMHFCEA
ncbi:MAG: glycoside hydrolase family 32 protein [Lachnospiraceae bacterium]|nr:glycoside hydrolase family 32 protein [Lachnospiraceae bacterium]